MKLKLKLVMKLVNGNEVKDDIDDEVGMKLVSTKRVTVAVEEVLQLPYCKYPLFCSLT